MVNQFSADPKAIPTCIMESFHYQTHYKTAIIVGVPQGGTSSVASVVDALGFPISEKQFNFETKTRPTCGDTEEVWTAKVTQINLKLDFWGVKDTLVWRFPSEVIHNSLRNPHYLIVSRDVVATAQRRAANHNVENVRWLLEQLEPEIISLWQWVKLLPSAPKLLVSYERLTQNRQLACEGIAEFLGVVPTTPQLQRAVDRVSSIGGYLKKEEEHSAGIYETIIHKKDKDNG